MGEAAISCLSRGTFIKQPLPLVCRKWTLEAHREPVCGWPQGHGQSYGWTFPLSGIWTSHSSPFMFPFVFCLSSTVRFISLSHTHTNTHTCTDWQNHSRTSWSGNFLNYGFVLFCTVLSCRVYTNVWESMFPPTPPNPNLQHYMSASGNMLLLVIREILRKHEESPEVS